MIDNPGVLAAISAGVLFGASTTLAKSLVHGIAPWMIEKKELQMRHGIVLAACALALLGILDGARR